MVVWGGTPDSGGTIFDTGGGYDPGIDSWTPTSTTNAPSARYYHTVVWTGQSHGRMGGLLASAPSMSDSPLLPGAMRLCAV